MPSSYCSLSSQIYRSLRIITLEPDQGSAKIQLLAAAVLRELSPLHKTLVREFTPPVDPPNIQYVLPVLLSQVTTEFILNVLVLFIICSLMFVSSQYL